MQLLEAASVLVAMNGTPQPEESSATPPESTKDVASEPESALSDPSGYSDQGDRASSADTTPPPLGLGEGFNFTSYRNKRHSSGSGFSRSYQSARSTSLLAGSAPNTHGFGHLRSVSGEFRPQSSGLNNSNQDDRDLAAAVELLSCSFGSSNGNSTVTLPADAPPVPPVPEQYRDQATSLNNGGFTNGFPSRPPESFTRGEIGRGSRSGKSIPDVHVIPDGDEDVNMEESTTSGTEDDEPEIRSRARAHSDDHEPVMFGMDA